MATARHPWLDAARNVLATSTACYVMPQGSVVPWGDAGRRAMKRGGAVLLDTFTASVILAVHDKLNDTNRAMFLAMSLPKAARVAFKLVK